MRNLIKTMLLMLITSVTLNAQKTNIFSKSFETNENTSVLIELKGTTVHFVNSPDNKLYINHNIEFKNISKKRKREAIESADINAKLNNNHIVINNTKQKSMFFFPYLSRKKPSKEPVVIRKSKKAILDRIVELKSYKSSYEEYVKTRYKDDSKKRDRLLKRANSFIKRNLVIKIPSHLKVVISSQGIILKFDENFNNEFNIRISRSRLYANKLTNTANEFKLTNSSIFVNELEGGKITFNNSLSALIGEIKNVEINSEFSKIEIGEIGTQTKITDFNGEYWFYNWSQNFQRFDLNSEYSKIHLFYPKANHTMEVVGNNTKHIIGKDFVANLQPTKKGEKHVMMEKKPQSNEAITGEIFFNIVHGIIYTHEDSIKTINK